MGTLARLAESDEASGPGAGTGQHNGFARLALSVLGFLAMLSGAVLAITSLGAGDSQPNKSSESERGGFGGKMEERFRRRFEQD